MALALAGASFAGTVTSVVDGLWMRASLVSDRPPAVLSLVRFDVGMVAPLALCLGAVVGAFAIALEPRRPRSPKELWRGLVVHDPSRKDYFAGFLASLGAGIALWATAVANWARVAMASEVPSVTSGLALAALSLGFAIAVAVMAFGAGELFARLVERGRPELDPRHGLIAGVALAASVIAIGVKVGTTSGTGSWLGIWGVLKRPELDLRAAALVSVIVLGAYLLPHLVQRTPVLAFFLALLPLGFTYEAAVGLGPHPQIANALERGAPLGKISLALLRRATDRDRDGYSSLFGGGDCDDGDARINPGAEDVPGNGIDEDCSGADAVIAPTQAVAALPSKRSDLLPTGLNVILVTIDTLRADVGYAGNPKPVSPNLDALAGRSVVFDRAYSLASYTGKSLGPLLIGKYPSETHRSWGHFNKFSTDDRFVSERLQKAGIHTISVQAHWYMTGAFGLARGYDVVDKKAQPPLGTDQDNDATVTGGQLTDAAIRVLSNPENTQARFFAWIHYLDPHSEYARHPEAPSFGTGMRAAYDGEVWYTDHQLGRVLDFVTAQPWGAHTAIIVTSDHGEAFGEHHMIRHGVEIWEELVRVPLVVYVPGVTPHHVAPARGGIDLVPTILDLFGVSGETPVGDFLSGRSLAADIAMPEGYQPPARDILVDMPAGPYNDERRAFIHGAKKLYVSGGVRYVLFDLERDPGEKSDASDDKALLAEMKAGYQAMKAQLREVRVKPVPKDATSP